MSKKPIYMLIAREAITHLKITDRALIYVIYRHERAHQRIYAQFGLPRYIFDPT